MNRTYTFVSAKPRKGIWSLWVLKAAGNASCLALIVLASWTIEARGQQAPPDSANDSLRCPKTGDANSHDCSTFLIAAIKSVSGDIPENEFFAAHWKVRYGDWAFTLASLDIALSPDDSTSSDQALTEAGAQVNLDLSRALKKGGFEHRRKAERSTYAGLGAKIFNAETYFTTSVGTVELRRSPFEGSYFQLGYARRLYPVSDSTRYNDSGQRLENDNVLIEFLIRSEVVNFFKFVMIRGGVLIPMLGDEGRFDDIQFRITVAVSAGGLMRF